MTTLDPYRQWLEIREQRRPLNHYELLGLTTFETDQRLIQSAYGEQMTRVRRYQVGAHMELAQRVINELSEAYVCLTDLRRKEAYDALLRRGETVDAQLLQTMKVVPPSEAPSTPQPPLQPVVQTAVTPTAVRRTEKRPWPVVGIVCGAAGLAGLQTLREMGQMPAGAKRALVISSEGATDRAAYERIVGQTASC